MKTLPTAVRKSIQVSAWDLVRCEPMQAGRALPLVLTPAFGDMPVDLPAWSADHRSQLEELLLRHGGLLFRGFDIATGERLEELIRALSGDLLEYQDRATPRSQVQDRIYSSTDYPASQTIELHNESCYAATFPRKIFFCCHTPAEEGGETPIADCREVYRRIDPEIRQRFAARGVMYVRNFLGGLGLSWQEAFQTDDPAEMERYCHTSGIAVEWRSSAHLRTRQVRPALVSHPRTGEPIWFNQAIAFHITTVPADIREKLIAELTEEGAPKNSCYGDGTPFEPEVLEALRQAYRQSTVDVRWQKGDVLMLDNLLAAHGRRPYAGARKVLVGMAEPLVGETIWRGLA